MKPLVLDFETMPIEDVPDGRVPAPIGMAMLIPSAGASYMAWGHESGNNRRRSDAAVSLEAYARTCDTLIAYNIGFDAEVARQHFGIDLSHLRWHDPQVMAFHEDPHSPTLELKKIAARYLDMPPDEQDAMRDWLRERKLIRSNVKGVGDKIHLVPGDIVGPYAIGDVERTWRLFQLWHQKYVGTEGYERDMRATRVGLKMTQRGVLIDRPLLLQTIEKAEHHVDAAKSHIAREFKLSVFDPNDRETLADSIERKFGVTLPSTATGRRATNKDVLFDALPDGKVKALLRYIGALSYDLKNYLRPWEVATAVTGGRIHPTWSVTRSDAGGARSGRLSSSPNMQNLRGVEGTENLVEMLRGWYADWDYWTPQIRSLIIPSDGNVIIGRDWSQIELRLTAHYEDGPMAENYNANPDWDLHAWVMERVKTLFGVTLIRRVAKNIGFGSIYGAGIEPIVKQSRISHQEAADFKRMYFEALPSLRDLMDDVQDAGKVRPITTLGGRKYAAEPARYDPAEGRWRQFYYKLLNYLIQGSAADLMKEAMIDADDYGIPLILSVHDEPVADCRRDEADDMLEAMRVAMDHNELIYRLTVPVVSNGYVANRWSEAEK